MRVGECLMFEGAVLLLKCYETIKLLRYLRIYRAVGVGRFTGQEGIYGCYI